MIENMAGKSGALHGLVHDATPFKFSEEDPAIDYFGQLLEKGTLSYYLNKDSLNTIYDNGINIF